MVEKDWCPGGKILEPLVSKLHRMSHHEPQWWPDTDYMHFNLRGSSLGDPFLSLVFDVCVEHPTFPLVGPFEQYR